MQHLGGPGWYFATYRKVLPAVKYEHLFLNAQIYAKISMKTVLYWKVYKLIFFSLDFILRGFGKQK